MNQSRLRHDITTSVERAVRERRDQRTVEQLLLHSDAELAKLPGVTGTPHVTTAAFLQRYDAAMHVELCRGTHPHAIAATVAEQLHDLTRAVLVSGAAAGMSSEAAIGMAVVVYKAGVGRFCAQPSVHRSALLRVA